MVQDKGKEGMDEHIDWKEVGVEEFYNFLNDREYEMVPGDRVHSRYYLDKDRRKIGYTSCSSWNIWRVYKIAEWRSI